LLKERAEMMNEVLEDIDRIIQKEAKKGKYDLILNTRIADTPILLYGKKDLELTDRVIKGLEKVKK
ncbi:MAG: OmpH family outer membrane protein, partial [Candidatus Omnitrophica bacterium]|nr:OmpH family outer membrane protein [Candidatus Omnitrophota bacterium]